MNKILWIQFNTSELAIGFSSVADADDFLDRQTNNPAWKRQFTLTREFPYDKETWILRTSNPVNFRNV